MVELTEDQKAFVVQQLACFVGPTDIARALKEEFDINPTLSQICKLDPSRPSYEGGEKWRPIFDAVRENYLKTVEAVPISQQAFRLNTLQKNLDKAMRMGNLKLANETLKQAAEEVGGILTNERNVNMNKGGGFRDLTPDERRMAVAEMLREALGADRVPPAPQQETMQ